jgi:hypothetical protein
MKYLSRETVFIWLSGLKRLKEEIRRRNENMSTRYRTGGKINYE